jgi:hypothetical protein
LRRVSCGDKDRALRDGATLHVAWDYPEAHHFKLVVQFALDEISRTACSQPDGVALIFIFIETNEVLDQRLTAAISDGLALATE